MYTERWRHSEIIGWCQNMPSCRLSLYPLNILTKTVIKTFGCFPRCRGTKTCLQQTKLFIPSSLSYHHSNAPTTPTCLFLNQFYLLTALRGCWRKHCGLVWCWFGRIVRGQHFDIQCLFPFWARWASAALVKAGLINFEINKKRCSSLQMWRRCIDQVWGVRYLTPHLFPFPYEVSVLLQLWSAHWVAFTRFCLKYLTLT